MKHELNQNEQVIVHLELMKNKFQHLPLDRM